MNDFWPCIIVNQSAMWLLLSIYQVLTGVIGYNAYEHFVATWNMNEALMLRRLSREYLLIFSLYRLPTSYLYMSAIRQYLDYPRYKTKKS